MFANHCGWCSPQPHEGKKGHTGPARPVPESGFETGFETHRELNGPPLAFGRRPGLEWIQIEEGQCDLHALWMPPSGLPGMKHWYRKQETSSHAANVLLPPMADIVYSPMKRNGASARDQYRSQQLKEVKQ